MEKEYSVRIGEQPIVFRTGKVAKQANGAVMASITKIGRASCRERV